MQQHPTQNWTRNSSALKIAEIAKIYSWFWRERGCPTKASFCHHWRTLVLNRDLEHLFPLLWICALTIPMSFTFWIYLDSCPEAPNWALATGNSCGIPSAFCFQWLLCCNRLAVRQTGTLEKASQPLVCRHRLSYQMCVWVLSGFHIWSVQLIFKHYL